MFYWCRLLEERLILSASSGLFLTHHLPTYQVLHLAANFSSVFFIALLHLSVCVGEGFCDTRALTKGKSGADMKHIRQGSACDATAEARKYFTAYPLDS